MRGLLRGLAASGTGRGLPAVALRRWDFRPLAMLTATVVSLEQARSSRCSTQKVSLGKVSDFEEASMQEVKLEGGSAVSLGHAVLVVSVRCPG